MQIMQIMQTARGDRGFDGEGSRRHGGPHHPSPTKKPRNLRSRALWWASQDLNPGPSGYEPPALTS